MFKNPACVLQKVDLSRNNLHLKTYKFLLSSMEEGTFPKSIQEINLRYNKISNNALGALEENIYIYNNREEGKLLEEEKEGERENGGNINNLDISRCKKEKEKRNRGAAPHGLAEYLAKIKNKQRVNEGRGKLIKKNNNTQNKSAIILRSEEIGADDIEIHQIVNPPINSSFTHNKEYPDLHNIISVEDDGRISPKIIQPLDHDIYVEGNIYNIYI